MSTRMMRLWYKRMRTELGKSFHHWYIQLPTVQWPPTKYQPEVPWRYKLTLVVPKYSAPVAVADVLVVFGTATMNSAAVGNGIGNVAVRDEQYPHCGYQIPIASHLHWYDRFVEKPLLLIDVTWQFMFSELLLAQTIFNTFVNGTANVALPPAVPHCGYAFPIAR